jgi:hypothetical protein
VAVTRRTFLVSTGIALGAFGGFPAAGDDAGMTNQFYFTSVDRALETLSYLAAPIHPKTVDRARRLLDRRDAACVGPLERLLERYTFARLLIGAEEPMRVEVIGEELTLNRFSQPFLVRVVNSTGSVGMFKIETGGERSTLAKAVGQALAPATMLSGSRIEYRVVQLYSLNGTPYR